MLIFNSGFEGALGSAAGLMRKGDVAVVDARAHISMVDGLKIGGAKIAFFEHNDPRALDEALSYTGARRPIFVDGLCSMDGDMADLPALLDVAESTASGSSWTRPIRSCAAARRAVAWWNTSARARVGVQYGTLSERAFSCGGGFAAAPTDLISALRFYSSAYGFLRAASVRGRRRVGGDRRDPGRDLAARSWENAALFRTRLQSLGINTGTSTSYVVPIVVGEDRALLYELGHQLRAHGLFLTPVDYPTVPLDQVRFRASVTALHTREVLDEALQILEDLFVPPMRARGLLHARTI